MMMRPVVCLLVFLLSVASLCVGGEVKPDEKLLHEAAASECPTESQESCPTEEKAAAPHSPPLPIQQPQAPSGGDDCTTGPPCSTSSRVATTASPTDCETLPKKEGCPESVPQTETNCGEGSGNTCPKEQQALTEAEEDTRSGQDSKGDRGLSGSETPHSTGKTSQNGPGGPSTDTDPSNPSPNVAEPAAPAPSGESVGASTTADQPETNRNSDAGGNSIQPDGDATQPSSDKESNDGSENTNTGSGTTSEGDGSTSNQTEGVAGNTDTTTITTTTLPPELTNNKKGDADSSSSISSSVWVRVPLLIVVTLACILVC
ncbi:uncharacterized protein TM35_000641080 [Trypanosoma theileri]|uniref:Uncharacterized protein n=1 Tax=Trypanosoma theileri TaxID=67003 RepID=A0A1X0NFT9_9TRYP|nr:uncharacterized protein TM35_000641080 [Trypanosoma theileri]ORC83576.1 hypothetical protein TM35_000641080 [Trypanosoma theileri]